MIARLGKNIYMILIFLFLYAPVAVLIVFPLIKPVPGRSGVDLPP